MAVCFDLAYRKLFFSCSIGACFATACLTPQFDFGESPFTESPFTESEQLTQGDANSEGGASNSEAGFDEERKEADDTMQVVVDEGDEPKLPAHCSDRKLNNNETGIDCGGASCEPCERGQSCIINADCLETPCTGNLCLEPTCTDGIKNQSETDVDCGGTTCSQCSTEQACAQDSDCESGACSSSTCQEPRCDDQRKNGLETDVDCGGDECSPCEFGQACSDEADCVDLSADPTGSANCTEGLCVIECSSGFADCNGDNSCSSDIQLAARCGGCLAGDPVAGDGIACAEKAGATARCSESACTWTCDGGFIDANNDLQIPNSNGCEELLATCAQAYKTNNQYSIGTIVSRSKKNWRCTNDNCRNPTCKPGDECGFDPWALVEDCF